MKESSYEMKCFHVSAIGKDERKKSKFYILRFCKILEFFLKKHEQNPIPLTNYTIHTQSSLPFPQENKFLGFPRQMQTLVRRIYTASTHNGLCTSSNHRPPRSSSPVPCPSSHICPLFCLKFTKALTQTQAPSSKHPSNHMALHNF